MKEWLKEFKKQSYTADRVPVTEMELSHKI